MAESRESVPCETHARAKPRPKAKGRQYTEAVGRIRESREAHQSELRVLRAELKKDSPTAPGPHMYHILFVPCC